MDEHTVMPIQNLIYEIRGQRVMLDSDLAQLYGVLTKNLNKAVKRNIAKFPSEFMFQLTKEEWDTVKSQFSMTKEKTIELVPIWNQFENYKHRSSLPFVFTEHGVLMTSNILNSEKANIISVEIVKVFIKLRKYTLSQNSPHEQITELRKLLMLHIENSGCKFSEHDEAIRHIVQALNNLIEQPKKTRPIGFNRE